MNLARSTLIVWLLAGSGLAQESIHPDWQVVDIGPGTKPAFDFGADDSIHVMGMTEEIVGVVWHAKAASIDGPWTPNTIAAGYFYGPGDIRVDPASGDAHLAWHDHDATAPRHAIIRPNGTMGSFILASNGHDGWDNSLVISPSGMLHMACVNPSAFGASNSLQHATFNGSAWTFNDTIGGSGSFMYGLNTSIALDSADKPHVLYCRSDDWATDGSLIHATAGSPTWTFEPVVAGGPIGRFPTLAIDDDDRLHATWLDINAANNSLGTIQYGVRDPTSGLWTITPVDMLDGVRLGFGHARKSASIALDSSGDPHIAYADTGVIRYAVLGDGDWERSTVLEDSLASYKSLVVLRLDSQDRPGIAFWQSGKLGDTVRLARPLPAPAPTTIDLGLVIALGDDPRQATLTFSVPMAGTYQPEWSGDLVIWHPLGDPIVFPADPGVPVISFVTDPDFVTRRCYRIAFSP